MIESLATFMDRLSHRRFCRSFFDRLADRRWWRIVFHHEAGHAVAWAARLGQYRDLTAQDQLEDDQFPARFRKASYGDALTQAEFDGAPLNATIVLAAGAQAERILFGIESDGFVGDRTTLRRLYFGPVGVNRVHLQEGLDLATQEIDSGYSQTQLLLRRHEFAIRAIGSAALDRLESEQLLGKRFERRVILTAQEVQQLFESHPPSER